MRQHEIFQLFGHDVALQPRDNMRFFNYLVMKEILNYLGKNTKELDTSPAADSARPGVL